MSRVCRLASRVLLNNLTKFSLPTSAFVHWVDNARCQVCCCVGVNRQLWSATNGEINRYGRAGEVWVAWCWINFVLIGAKIEKWSSLQRVQEEECEQRADRAAVSVLMQSSTRQPERFECTKPSAATPPSLTLGASKLCSESSSAWLRHSSAEVKTQCFSQTASQDADIQGRPNL